MQDQRLNCSVSCCQIICGFHESSTDLGIPLDENCGRSFSDSRADLLPSASGSSSSEGSSSSSISSNRACCDILSNLSGGWRIEGDLRPRKFWSCSIA